MSAENSSIPAQESSATSSSSQTPDPASYKVYKPPRTGHNSPRELPDDYFTPSAADLKAAQAALSARTQALTNAPFQARAVRETDEKAKRERWPETTIRIRFTDRMQLEKTFPSADKIRSVYAFVRNSLREDAKPSKFILYQPPKRDLKVSDPAVRDLSLAELQLAPSSVLLVRFLDESMNHPDYPAPLAESVIEHAEDLPTPPDFDNPNQQQPASKPSTSSSSKPSTTATGEKKIPKWLKLAGGKK
ncbi:hypothetical protein EVG20_g10651 [Dentipellis fragilis]|uniref:UBX domain-containing protein n=1 Tax=Dentipellis fragilis TaxID=205917 RepID=A0A4Y9XQ35_9AGAM|nr:hypothetical protein EVG20_g10651 [Dentipellis fragilis]